MKNIYDDFIFSATSGSLKRAVPSLSVGNGSVGSDRYEQAVALLLDNDGMNDHLWIIAPPDNVGLDVDSRLPLEKLIAYQLVPTRLKDLKGALIVEDRLFKGLGVNYMQALSELFEEHRDKVNPNLCIIHLME